MTLSKIKYLLITLMLSIASATTHAQMAVAGFELDLRDQTANNESTKVIGKTPMLVEKILVGNHEVVLSNAGCAERRESVNVTEGQTSTIEGKLADGQDVRLSCGVERAHWIVDGVDRGVGAEITVNLSYAEHSVSIKAEKYRDFAENFTVEAATTSKSFVQKSVPKDVETITVNGVSFNMRLVEGGTFQMGSNDVYSDEKPVHRVTLSDYYIGETEVTQALWTAVMGTTVGQQRDKANPEWPLWGEGNDYPMYYISWGDCQEFIRRLNQLTGRTFALPTEAQWEYAARGGNKNRGYRYSGSDDITRVAWCYDNSSSQTHPAAAKQANELGLYDMSGNVWEWCSDWYGSEYYKSSSSVNPTGPSSGSYRVLRGGGWYSYASRCRSAYRSYNRPDSGSSYYGLRLLLLY